MNNRIAVVIPCYKVKAHILGVLAGIGPEVDKIYVIDDQCPENSGQFVAENVSDKRVSVIFNEKNLGVGGAVKRGYREALKDGIDIIVKVDGDGQMNPAGIKNLVAPILDGKADYTKGNRFYNIDDVKAMPLPRLIGNAGLSFLTKLSSGYWHLFDPTNGFCAIHRTALSMISLNKIADRYFFESDILFRLNTINASVLDIPMKAVYADEISNLSIVRSIPEFFMRNLKNFIKRIFYNYFLRNFSLASLELIFGLMLFVMGFITGSLNWLEAIDTGVPASTGNVVLPALEIILGFQLLLSFLNYDIESKNDYPIQKRLTSQQ